jgi:hypothetical protein
MHEPMSHPHDGGPRQFRHLGTGFVGNLARCLADDFDRPNQREQEHLVAFEVASIATFHESHRRGHGVGQLATEVVRIAEYATALSAAGWPRVRIVTDHGWLLMPGGFEGVRLPPSAVISKGARAAILQEHAAAELAFLPWHWDESVRIAVPPGAEAFRAGEVYSHGGLSPQECVIPDITVGGDAATGSGAAARISTISWRRLRLTVELTGELTDVTVEVRRKERDSASRVDVASAIEGSRARLTISDEVEEGDPVLVVLIDRHGSVIDARATRVGERT